MGFKELGLEFLIAGLLLAGGLVISAGLFLEVGPDFCDALSPAHPSSRRAKLNRLIKMHRFDYEGVYKPSAGSVFTSFSHFLLFLMFF